MPKPSPARPYGSDLTDAQWQRIKLFFERQTFRKHSPRQIVNALFYLSTWSKPAAGGACFCKEGAAGFPPRETVYYPFRQWVASGLIGRLTDALRPSQGRT
jgi:transposase